MKTFSRRDLSELAETTGEHLVSMYMSTYSGPDAQQNRIRFKNLLSAAESGLIRRGVRSTDARKLLASASESLDESNAWEEQGPSLAVFVGPGGIRTYRLPIGCDEVCRVGKYFHVVPLLVWLTDEAPFFVLAVSQNDVRLFYGRRGGIEEVHVPGLPASRKEALRLDNPEPSRQQHAAQPAIGGKQSVVFHGQGGAPDAAKQEILAFCREIDRALADVLRLRTEPLIFAGVDYLFPIFDEVSGYPHLLPNPIAGNPELWSPGEIHQRAWPMLDSMIRERRQAALSKYGNSIPLGQAVDGVQDTIMAAHAGAVETLLIDVRARVTGQFDAEHLAVRVDEAPREDSEDLLNLVSIMVLRSSAAVEPLEPSQLPGGRPMAAVLRYPLPSPEESVSATART